MSSAYLRLLIFLWAILIPACASSSLAFLMMYSAISYISRVTYIALMYSFPNLEPVCCSMSRSNCCFLTCIQVSQETGKVVWYSRLFKNFPHYEQMKWRWWNSSWAISNPKRWCCESAALNMPASLENSAVAIGLEKVTFHSNPKEGQCQRMFKLMHNCTHFTS